MSYIRVVVQDEEGNEVGAPIDVPAHIIAHPDNKAFFMLRFIDSYGNTVFNRLQLPLLIEDLRLLRQQSVDAEEISVIQGIERLATACQKEPHLYLNFIGD